MKDGAQKLLVLYRIIRMIYTWKIPSFANRNRPFQFTQIDMSLQRKNFDTLCVLNGKFSDQMERLRDAITTTTRNNTRLWKSICPHPSLFSFNVPYYKLNPNRRKNNFVGTRVQNRRIVIVATCFVLDSNFRRRTHMEQRVCWRSFWAKTINGGQSTKLIGTNNVY